MINYKENGKNKLFYFDLKRETTEVVFNIIESNKALDFQLKNKRESIIINELLKYCESIIVFGSYTSGK